MNSNDIARGGPLPQPQSEPPTPSIWKTMATNFLIGAGFWAVVGMVRASWGLARLAFRDEEKKK